MKKKWWILLVFLFMFLVGVIIFLIVTKGDKEYKIIINTDGGSEVSNIEIKDNKIVKLPDEPVKEGYTFVAWKNESNQIIREGMKVTKDLEITAVWISDEVESFEVTFDTDGGNEIEGIKIENGKVVMLPIDPVKEGYNFICWLDENNNIVNKDTVITKNTILKAYFISKDAKTYEVTFDTDGGNEIEDIIIEDGKVIFLPINPTKEGYVFAGWVDSKGEKITKDTIVSGDIVIKATWKEPYTCPSGCTVNADGKTCTKVLTSNMITVYNCPSGYTNKNGYCVDTKNAIPASQTTTCKDGSTPVSDSCPNMKKPASSAYDCAGNEYFKDGYCIPNATYGWACPSGYYKYTHIEGMGAVDMCAKTAAKVSSQGCPSGYVKDGNICKKNQVLNCTAN